MTSIRIPFKVHASLLSTYSLNPKPQSGCSRAEDSRLWLALGFGFRFKGPYNVEALMVRIGFGGFLVIVIV